MTKATVEQLNAACDYLGEKPEDVVKFCLREVDLVESIVVILDRGIAGYHKFSIPLERLGGKKPADDPVIEDEAKPVEEVTREVEGKYVTVGMHDYKLEDMTVKELRQYAKDSWIDVKGIRKKADLVEALGVPKDKSGE